MAEGQGDWRSEAFRRKVIAQIDEAVRSSNTSVAKSSVEMENHVFHKTKTREEYLALVARLTLHIKDHNNQKRKKAQQQAIQQAMATGMQPQPMGGGSGMPGGGGMVGGAGMGGGAGMPDPINALQNMAMSGTGMPPGQQPDNQKRKKAQQQAIQQAMATGMQPQPMGGGSGMPGGGGMVGGAGMGGVAGMGGGAGMPDPINALQNMAMSGTGMPPGQQPGNPGSVGAAPSPASQSAEEQAYLDKLKQLSKYIEPLRRMIKKTEDDPKKDADYKNIINKLKNLLDILSNPSRRIKMSMLIKCEQVLEKVQFSPKISSPQVGNPASQGPVPSPVQPMSQPAGSPGMPMMIPSPQSHIVPSPGPRTNMSAPSPSTALNMPGNPGSVGAAPSPASQSAEEQAYLDKLKQLSKYIEPLHGLIKRTEDDPRNDADFKNNIKRLKNLLDILGNPSKRVNMSTLIKCEQVLEKVQFSPIIHPSTPATTAIVGALPMVMPTAQPAPHTHMCQPLLDTVAAHITSPTFNHTLQRTFGPAVSALYGTPIRAPSPPPKRQKFEEPPGKIPDVLQGEIDRLDRRFKVKLDHTQHRGSSDKHLVCR